MRDPAQQLFTERGGTGDGERIDQGRIFGVRHGLRVGASAEPDNRADVGGRLRAALGRWHGLHLCLDVSQTHVAIARFLPLVLLLGAPQRRFSLSAIDVCRGRWLSVHGWTEGLFLETVRFDLVDYRDQDLEEPFFFSLTHCSREHVLEFRTIACMNETIEAFQV